MVKRRSALSFAVLFAAAQAAGEPRPSADVLSLTVGPRQIGMGGAGVAVADDLFGSNGNPAALGRLWRQEAATLYTQWFEDVTFQTFGYAYPHARHGTFAASFMNLDYGKVQGYSSAGARTQTLSASDRIATIGYGRSVAAGLWAGAHLKYWRQTLHDVSAQAFAADLGAVYALPLSGWLRSASVGASARNLGTSAKFDSQAAPLPREINFGAALRPMFESLSVAADFSKTQGGDPAAKLGVEYWARDVVAFRMGYNSAYDIGTGLGFGFGFKVAGMQIDYAFSDYGNLGNTHHVALTYRFGSVAETHYQQGMRYMRLRDYAKAIIAFNRALSVDHTHRRAILRIKEANERLQAALNDLKQ